MRVRPFEVDFYTKTNGEYVEFYFDVLSYAEKCRDELKFLPFACLEHDQCIGEKKSQDGIIFTTIQRGIKLAEIDTNHCHVTPNEIPKRYVLRIKNLNRFCPGQVRPASTIEKNTEVKDQTLFHIGFDHYEAALFYREQLAAMNITAIPHLDGSFIQCCAKTNKWILCIDQSGKQILDVLEKYSPHLMPHEALSYVDQKCLELLADFKQTTGWYYFLTQVQPEKNLVSRTHLKRIFEDPMLSPLKKVEFLRANIVNRERKKEQEAQGILGAMSPLKYSAASNNFFENAGEYDFQEKLDVILKEAKKIKNPLFPHQFESELLAPVPSVVETAKPEVPSQPQITLPEQYFGGHAMFNHVTPSAPPIDTNEIVYQQNGYGLQPAYSPPPYPISNMGMMQQPDLFFHTQPLYPNPFNYNNNPFVNNSF